MAITYGAFTGDDRAAAAALLDSDPQGLSVDWRTGSARAQYAGRMQVAHDGERVVGLILLWLVPLNGNAQIAYLVVDRAYRAHGIGATLVAWARETAQAEGMRRMYVDTSHDNARGMMFLIRQGFVPEICRFDFFRPGLHQVFFTMDLPYSGGDRSGSGGDRAAAPATATIDPYTEADRATVIALLDAITWRGSGEGVLDDALRNDWEVYVAHDAGGTPVGTLLLQITQWNTTAHIGMLAVLPEYQGRSIGAALVDRAKASARAQSLRRLTVGTGHQNWRAQLFYLRHGFTPEVRRHDFGGPGVHEVLLWQDL